MSHRVRQHWLRGNGSEYKDIIIDEAAAVLVVEVTFSIALLISILCGRHTGNPRYVRDTILLGCAVVGWRWRDFFDIHPSRISTSFYTYTVIPLLFQATVALTTSAIYSRRRKPAREQEGCFCKPALFPSRTTHTRLFPTAHSFSYSYLLVGLPVPLQKSHNTIASTEISPGRTTWFSINSDDYLMRGGRKDGLQGKLCEYLLSVDINPERYADAYLVTAPRFLGFAFNPVSFWYLYDEHHLLSAMILEVNNTFDERRMYFLAKSELASDTMDEHFRHVWNKDFHVSPFNDRIGAYSLTAKNPFATSHARTIDNNIVLQSKEGRAKVVARVYSVGGALDPTAMTHVQAYWFLVKWWWVGFMTNPRILREARILWTKKLKVFYRPEVVSTSIGRSATTDETFLETLFRKFLQSLVDGEKKIVQVWYTPAAGPDNGRKVQLLPASMPSEGGAEQLELRVLTPAFYAELLRAGTIREVFDKHCISPTEGEAMLEVSNSILLQQLLVSTKIAESTGELCRKELFLLRLRHRNTHSLSSAYIGLVNRRNCDDLQLSEYDMFVKQTFDLYTYRAYLRCTTWLLLADCLAFGFMPLLYIYLWIGRLMAMFGACLSLSDLIAKGATLRTMTVYCGCLYGLHMMMSLCNGLPERVH